MLPKQPLHAREHAGIVIDNKNDISIRQTKSPAVLRKLCLLILLMLPIEQVSLSKADHVRLFRFLARRGETNFLLAHRTITLQNRWKVL